MKIENINVDDIQEPERGAGFFCIFTSIVLCSVLLGCLIWLEGGFWRLQRRLDVCEAKLLDQRLAGELAKYKLKRIGARLDAFSYSYSPALEAMVGRFMAEDAVRKERFYAWSEAYAGIYPDQPFDVTRAWRYMLRSGFLREVKR